MTVSDEVASYLNNRKRRELARLEDDGDMSIQILGREEAPPEFLDFECEDASGHAVKFLTLETST